MTASAVSAGDPGRSAEPARRLRTLIGSTIAAVWTVFAVAASRLRSRRQGVDARAPRCPPLPSASRFAVWWTLDRLPATCLERALVLQQWSLAHGHVKDVHVGVPVEGVGRRAIHAWVDGDPHVDPSTYTLIHRLAPVHRDRPQR